MPVILRHLGFKFFFYSNEGNPREPAHIHVRSANREAKFWLAPVMRLARNDGYDAQTLRELTDIIMEHHKQLLEAWNGYFS